MLNSGKYVAVWSLIIIQGQNVYPVIQPVTLMIM